MSHTFNKIFVYFSLTLLLASTALVLCQAAIKASNHKNNSLEIAKAEESAKAEEPINLPQVLGQTSPRNLDLFFDPNFLQIQETLFDEKSASITFQNKVVLEESIMPPQAVRVYDVKNGQVVTIIWDKFNNPPAKVKIFRSESSIGKAGLLAEIDGSSPGYHDTDIEIGKRYYYTLISADQDSGESQPAGPYIAGPIKDLTAPARPNNVKIEANEQGLAHITWEDPADADLRFINVYRSENPGDLGANIAQVAPGIGDFVDEAVDDAAAYYYLLTSEDLAGNESHYHLIESETGRKNPFMPVF